ncbi:MAG: MBL fold metallo-hydrolase [Lautropia sp.]
MRPIGMPVRSFPRRARLLVTAGAFAAALGAAPAAPAQSADTLIKRATMAMGGDGLKTLRYTAEGTGHTFGQAFRPGLPWPKITIHGQTRSIDYAGGALRDEIVLSRAEPRGGGGYPITGQQRNDQFFAGNYAWNVVGGNPAPNPRFTIERAHQLWTTPHGVLLAAARNQATVSHRKVGERSLPSLTFTEPLRFRATIHLDAQNRVARIDSRLPDPVLGEVSVVTRFSDYRSHGALQFPGRIRQSQGGHPTLDVTVKEVAVNPPVAIAVPDAVRNATERVAVDAVAEGVWFIAGGSHNSVAIEMSDHLILVESPLFDGRAQPVLERANALVAGKPVRYVINSHGHFDHAGGIRAAIASGATIVTHRANRPMFEMAAASPVRIAPDALARSGRKPRLVAVDDRHVMKDARRTVELHRIAGGNHAEAFLMVWLPAERLLIEADAFTPGAPGSAPPATPNPNHVNLVENIERLKLDVDRILPLHGRVVPVTELYTAVGRKK